MTDITLETARRNADQLGIRYEQLTRFPFWASWFEKGPEGNKTRVAAKVMDSSASIGRELTQPENDAIAYHFNKILVTNAYAKPLVIATAAGFLIRTRATHGFPFWTPKPSKFDPSKFPLLPEGYASQFAWQGVRVVSWYAASKLLVGLVMSYYALSVYVGNMKSDPRLKEYREDLIRRHGANRAQGFNQRPGMAKGFPEQRQQSSPSFGRGPAPESAPAPESSAGTEQSAQALPSTWPGMQNPQPEQTRESFSDEPYFFDDASPVAPSERQNGASKQPTEGSSAWDRIRGQTRGGGSVQGQAPGGQANAWTKKREDELTSHGAQQGTSYTYSPIDEERAYAKEQAQREFDELLERERRGQSNTSGRR